jgi:hypothetical protein
MVDVDFRYVERDALDYSRFPPAYTEKVLQWRKKVVTDPLAQAWGWAEWQDVRTEEE